MSTLLILHIHIREGVSPVSIGSQISCLKMSAMAHSSHGEGRYIHNNVTINDLVY